MSIDRDHCGVIPIDTPDGSNNKSLVLVDEGSKMSGRSLFNPLRSASKTNDPLSQISVDIGDAGPLSHRRLLADVQR